MEKYKVYLLTFPNGKKYCGFTSKPLHRRWANRNGYKKCPLVYKAILKYGWINIRKECIFSSEDRDTALQKEKEIIKTLKLTDTEHGYNLHEGGQPTGSSSFLTEDGRRRIIKALTNRIPTQKQVETARNLNLGKHLSEETKRKISESKKGQRPSNMVSVEQIEKGTEKVIKQYPSATDVANALGHPGGASNILKVCKKQRRTAYGYEWRFNSNE